MTVGKVASRRSMTMISPADSVALSPDAEFSVVAEYDGEPNGLKIHRDGTIWLADFRHGIMTLDPATGTVQPVVTEIDGAPLKGPNDLVFSRAGDLYFTDQGASGLTDPTGRVVCRRSDGTLEIILDNAPSPNGLVLNRSVTTLSLAVTRGNAIWRVPLPPRGERPSKVGLAKYITETNHFFNAMVFNINAKFFDRLAPDLQKILTDAAVKAQDFDRRSMVEENRRAHDDLIAKGVQFVVPDAATLDAFRAAVASIYTDAKAKGSFGVAGTRWMETPRATP